MAVNKNNRKLNSNANTDNNKNNTSVKQTAKAVAAPPRKRMMKNSFKEPTTSLLYLIPFIAVLIIIPLIIRYHSFTNNLQNEYWHATSSTSSDLFLYFKGVWFIGFAAVLLFLLISSFVIESKKPKREIELIPLCVYAVFVILSTITTENIYFSLHGIENHFESVWVLLAYVLMVIYAVTMVDNTKALKVVIWGWMIGTWILMIIGVFQAFKLDFFLSDWIKWFILPEKSMQGSKMKLNFPLGQVYITLYNPNYVGYYASLTIPVCLTLAFASKEIWKKIVFGATVVGIFICSVASGAKNGLIALIVSLIFLIIMFRKQIFKFWYILVAGIVLLVGVFFGINQLNDNMMIDSLKYAFKTMTTKDQTVRHVNSIKTENDGIIIDYDGKDFMITMDSDNSTGKVAVEMFEKVDDTFKPIEVELTSSNYFVSKAEDFQATVFALNIGVANSNDTNKVTCIDVIIDGYDYIFTNELQPYGYEDSYYYRNASWKWLKMREAETAIFDSKPKLFSNRGYIWARTIPLLKDNIIVGSGPDTFVLEFPNYDYVNSAYVGFLNQIVTKPHNLYLQMAVQTGCVSAIAFIVFCLMYLVRSVMLYWKHPLDTLNSKLGIGIAAAVIGYLVSGIINDSTLSYAPVFWGIIGVGIALNRLVKNEFEGRPKPPQIPKQEK